MSIIITIIIITIIIIIISQNQQIPICELCRSVKNTQLPTYDESGDVCSKPVNTIPGLDREEEKHASRENFIPLLRAQALN
jgi:hypothetical protein